MCHFVSTEESSSTELDSAADGGDAASQTGGDSQHMAAPIHLREFGNHL